MHRHRLSFALWPAALAGAWLAVASVCAQDAAKKPDAGPSASEMAKMMEMAQPGENHKLLGGLAGSWDYKIKFWMDPNAPAFENSGVAERKAVLGGRYFATNVSGKVQMPGAEGKMESMDFNGMQMEAYDNVKQKFVSTWVDNMGTGIMVSEGTYDPATKTFTYAGELEMLPGDKTKVRETVQIEDKDHHTFSWFEDRGGKFVKTMEIKYTRQK